MKQFKTIIVYLLVIVCAYGYTQLSCGQFEGETFFMFLVLAGYIAWFLRFLDRLFSR